jgi:hypothetical protein
VNARNLHKFEFSFTCRLSWKLFSAVAKRRGHVFTLHLADLSRSFWFFCLVWNVFEALVASCSQMSTFKLKIVEISSPQQTSSFFTFTSFSAFILKFLSSFQFLILPQNVLLVLLEV